MGVHIALSEDDDEGRSIIGVFASQEDMEQFFALRPWVKWEGEEWALGQTDPYHTGVAPMIVDVNTGTYWTWIDGAFTNTGEVVPESALVNARWIQRTRRSDTPFLKLRPTKHGPPSVAAVWGWSPVQPEEPCE